VLYDGVRDAAAKLDVDVVLLHLGGVRFPVTGPLRYTMNAREGLELTRLIKPRVTIPIHYEGWKHFREGRAAIEREFVAAGEPLTWLPIGEPLEV
jgi:L-ascorbate metabolism protein UlaG (beta-lactamase superfamily)